MNLTLKRNKKITTEEIKKNIDKNGNVIIRVEEPEEINFISASYRRKTLPGKYVTVEMLQEANYVTEEGLQKILQEANYVTEERLQQILKEANYITEAVLDKKLLASEAKLRKEMAQMELRLRKEIAETEFRLQRQISDVKNDIKELKEMMIQFVKNK